MEWSKKYEQWIRHSVATIAAHPRECWHQNISKNKVYIYPTLYREREREKKREAGRGRAMVQKDLWINAPRKEIDLISSFEHLVWTTSWDGKGSKGALALCIECHFSRTQTKWTQMTAVYTTVCGNHAFCTCILFHPVGQLLSLCVSKTDILYERFMRLRCKRHSTASPGKQNLHLRAKSPVRRYARARLEILPVKTVKRGEARQGALDSWSLFLRKK